MHSIPLLIFLATILLCAVLSAPRRLLLDRTGRNSWAFLFASGSWHLGWSQVLLTAIVLLAAVYFITSPHFDEKQKHWAYASIGTIVGYWLKR